MHRQDCVLSPASRICLPDSSISGAYVACDAIRKDDLKFERIYLYLCVFCTNILQFFFFFFFDRLLCPPPFAVVIYWWPKKVQETQLFGCLRLPSILTAKNSLVLASDLEIGKLVVRDEAGYSNNKSVLHRCNNSLTYRDGPIINHNPPVICHFCNIFTRTRNNPKEQF